MTHDPETGAINRLHFLIFLAPVFRRLPLMIDYSLYVWNGNLWRRKIMNVSESHVGDEFAEAAAINVAGIVAKGKLTRKPCYRRVNARCALYGCLKNFGSPWLRPLLLFISRNC